VRIKNEKKQRSLEKKQKMAESRKHLSDIRVLQRNLVFVTGIPPKLADVEVLKKPEYFGRYGKIHKCVLNQQGPVATAYATYVRDEDAFKAVLGINGTYLQNNILRASLGTTKYCSYFLRHLPCPKQDCMYLHGLGDGAASFTKADMQAGKHQQYENVIFREYFSKKAETMKQNISRQKIDSKDDLCQNSTRDAWCSSAPTDLLEPHSIRSISESEPHFFNKSSLSDPDLSAGSRESCPLVDGPANCDWKEVNSQRRNSLSSPSEDELDFDPWEISKDGLEELIQNQIESDPPTSVQSTATTQPPFTSTTQSSFTPTTQSSFQISPQFQVQNNFINHIQQKPEQFLFPSFQPPQQPTFSPFNLGGMQPHSAVNPVDRLFGHTAQSLSGPQLPQFNSPKKQTPFSDPQPTFFQPHHNGFDHHNQQQHQQYPDIRLHDPSIVSTSPGERPSPAAANPASALNMNSLQQGLQELFPHANISFSGQRVRQAPPGFQNVQPSYTNQLLCQQLQTEHNVIKIQ